MKAPRFTKWFAALRALNPPQRLRVLDALRPAAGLHQVLALIEQYRSAGRRCPHCQCERWHRHGHANDLQRYRCFACRRTFNDLTGTPLARLRLKGKWLDYLDALRASRSVRAAADANAAYRAFARAHGIAHQAVNTSAGERMRSGSHAAIHVQDVNAYDQRLREWLLPFHGVASRYLPNYLGWRRMLDGGKMPSADQLFSLAIGPIHSER